MLASTSLGSSGPPCACCSSLTVSSASPIRSSSPASPRSRSRPGRTARWSSATAQVVGSTLIGQSFDGDAGGTSRAGRPRPATATTRSRPRRRTSARQPGPARRGRGAPGRGRRARRRRLRRRPRRRPDRPAAPASTRTSAPAYAAQQVARVAAARGLDVARGARARRASTPRAASSASSASRASTCSSSTSPSTQRATAGTVRLRTDGHVPRQAPGLPRRRARRRARPTRCSARATGAPSAAPTSSSAFVETHGRAHTAELLDGLEVVPRRHGRPTAARRSRRWTSTPSSPAGPQVALVDELAHTNVPGLPQREALAGRRGTARRRHRRHHDRQHPAPRVAQRRRREDHRRRRSARRCPTPSCGRPTRSSSST